MKLTLNLDNNKLNQLCGTLNANIIFLEKKLNVVINNKGVDFHIKGTQAEAAALILTKLSQQQTIHINNINFLLKEYSSTNKKIIQLTKTRIIVNNLAQLSYIDSIDKFDCIFAIGPAGTGKTYLAVAKAVEAIEQLLIDKIILVRPAVEAGEKLGFLPGDINDKVDPYLRPIYDALYDFLGDSLTEKMLRQNIIEIAPLAFMRGRTLNNAFIILDEAQNTTKIQMKMFLTRLGFNSKMIIAGDVSQIDIERPRESGLLDAIKVLSNERDIAFCHFTNADIKRHDLVNKIIQAYKK